MDPIPAQPRAPSRDDPTIALPLEYIDDRMTQPDSTTVHTSSHSKFLELPHEIQLLIFTFISKGGNEPFIRRTLSMCSRVCRSMHAFHQPALFASVELVHNRSWKPDRPCRILAFYRTLLGSPSLGKLVHVVTLQANTYSAKIPGIGIALPNALAMLPSLLPNVSELRLCGLWPGRFYYREFMWQALIFWRQTLRIFIVDHIYSRAFVEVLFGWEALEHFEVKRGESAFYKFDNFDPLKDPATQAKAQPNPSGPSLKTAIQRIFRRRETTQDTVPNSEERLPTVNSPFSLKTLTLHFESRLFLSSPSRFTTSSGLFRFCGATLYKLHITGNPSAFTAALDHLPSLRCLRIDILPIFAKDPKDQLVNVIWLLRFVRQRSSAKGRVVRWNLKEVQMDAFWFPRRKTVKPAVLLQLQDLARALVEFNEAPPMVVIGAESSKIYQWKGLIRDLEGVETSVREIN
ncbi:hypothetical protein DL96DRAFT_1561003 [Flagelloscypha sp. PMI_526]|nr:hypothetical protein DL96DRAFT_1561003 [Flagelloscypha sp. PMI_526]